LALAQPNDIDFSVYDITGRKIRTGLRQARSRLSQYHGMAEMTTMGVASGVYFAELRQPASWAVKMTLLR
jgi:hypothetical protein